MARNRLIGCVVLVTAALVFSVITASAGQEVFKWRAQTYAVPGSVGYRALASSLDHLKEASGGRLDIKLYGVGQLVGAVDQLDAMGRGIFEAGFNAPAYYSGKDPAFAALFNLNGIWSSTSEVKTWFHYFGGKELAEELYGKYKVHYVGPALVGAEPIMSKVPIRSLDDFKGIKIRTPGGLSSMLFAELGASPVPLPGSELYTAIDTGVVDAVEFVSLAENWDIGLQEVSEYVLYPSFHGPIALCDFTVSDKAWNKLPVDLQKLLESWVFELDTSFDNQSTAESLKALQKMKDKGLVITQLSDADMKKARQLSLEIANEWKKKSPMSAKVIDSIIDYLKLSGAI